MSTTIVRHLAVTVSCALNSVFVNSMCALLCHTKKTQDTIHDKKNDLERQPERLCVGSRSNKSIAVQI